MRAAPDLCSDALLCSCLSQLISPALNAILESASASHPSALGTHSKVESISSYFLNIVTSIASCRVVSRRETRSAPLVSRLAARRLVALLILSSSHQISIHNVQSGGTFSRLFQSLLYGMSFFDAMLPSTTLHAMFKVYIFPLEHSAACNFSMT